MLSFHSKFSLPSNNPISTLISFLGRGLSLRREVWILITLKVWRSAQPSNRSFMTSKKLIPQVRWTVRTLRKQSQACRPSSMQTEGITSTSIQFQQPMPCNPRRPLQEVRISITYRVQLWSLRGHNLVSGRTNPPIANHSRHIRDRKPSSCSIKCPHLRYTKSHATNTRLQWWSQFIKITKKMWMGHRRESQIGLKLLLDKSRILRLGRVHLVDSDSRVPKVSESTLRRCWASRSLTQLSKFAIRTRFTTRACSSKMSHSLRVKC